MEREESTDGHKHSLAYGARAGVLAALCALCAAPAFGASLGEVTNDKKENETSVDDARGFTAQVDIDAELFRYESQKFSDAKERSDRADSSLIKNYPFGSFNLFDDTNISFGYTGDRFGGKIVINKADVLSGIKLWIGFLNNKIKITAGNDIGYSYADSQGADAGLRVYDDNVRSGRRDEGRDNPTIDSNKNPDNITQDKGILLEFDLDPVKIALAGGGNLADIAASHAKSEPVSGNPNMSVYGFNFQYGANVGSKIGNYAKVNAAYILQAKKETTLYRYDPAIGKVVATEPNAEMWNHLFGAYVSAYPFGDETLGITLGYAGVFVNYLKDYELGETNVPRILKNGINLTARYKTGKLTIKTDHNYSFWSDKNYKIFYLYKEAPTKQEDFGLISKTAANAAEPDLTHSFLWNGLGASYRFTELFEGHIYVRNLLRADATKDYTMRNMYFSCELKSIFRFNPNVEAYASLVYGYTGRTMDKEMLAGLGEFTAGNTPKDTSDYLQAFSIPIGITIKLQRDVPARNTEPKTE